MESSTKSNQRSIGDGEWGKILAHLPREIDLEASAREAGALQRKREIRSGVDLLRVVFAYAVCDWSLRMVGAWCTVIGLGNLSDVAVLKRLRNCQAWLGEMVSRILEICGPELRLREGLRLRIMDGTWVSKPGSKGPDWVVHLSFDLGHLCVDGLEITDAKSGERFGHCPTWRDDIRMGDRAYAFSNSMGEVLKNGGKLVVRINWSSVPLETPDGQKVNLIANLEGLTSVSGDQEVLVRVSGTCFPVRLVLGALPQPAADKARQRIRKLYRKKGKTPDQRTLLAAGYVMILTNLSSTEWPALEILKLYRFRWQVELLFKRLKSILNLDHLRALEPRLSQVYLLGKMMAVLLMDKLFQQAQLRCPPWFSQINRPLSIWRLTILLSDHLRQIIRGTIPLQTILDTLPVLQRFLCDSPRQRPLQFAHARTLLSHFALLASSNPLS